MSCFWGKPSQNLIAVSSQSRVFYLSSPNLEAIRSSNWPAQICLEKRIWLPSDKITKLLKRKMIHVTDHNFFKVFGIVLPYSKLSLQEIQGCKQCSQAQATSFQPNQNGIFVISLNLCCLVRDRDDTFRHSQYYTSGTFSSAENTRP